MLLFGAGQTLPWLLLAGAGLTFALRVRGRHGARWAVAGFGLLTVCTAARLLGEIYQAYLVTAVAASSIANLLWTVSIWNAAFGFLALFGHVAVLAALVKAWRAADAGPVPSPNELVI
ncbi:hypothetical protein [Alienimonas sp. DA493]|uniref:hypothetical protein n=1 Tax=Alienimonas sp. DA493 TaxID=3373605 RepID=UPI0037544D70